MSQVCVRDRRNRDDPIEASCLDYSWVYDKTMDRLQSKADAKEQQGVVIQPPSTTTSTTTTTVTPKRYKEKKRDVVNLAKTFDLNIVIVLSGT